MSCPLQGMGYRKMSPTAAVSSAVEFPQVRRFVLENDRTITAKKKAMWTSLQEYSVDIPFKLLFLLLSAVRAQSDESYKRYGISDKENVSAKREGETLILAKDSGKQFTSGSSVLIGGGKLIKLVNTGNVVVIYLIS